MYSILCSYRKKAYQTQFSPLNGFKSTWTMKGLTGRVGGGGCGFT